MEEDVCVSFLEHDSFTREIEKFHKKYNSEASFRYLKKLLELHFHPVNCQITLTPKVLRRVDRLGANIEVYKVTMNVKGLRQGQCPRVCFRHVGNMIVFLCFGTHIDNYKDSELKEEVKQRIKDIDPQVEFN